MTSRLLCTSAATLFLLCACATATLEHPADEGPGEATTDGEGELDGEGTGGGQDDGGAEGEGEGAQADADGSPEPEQWPAEPEEGELEAMFPVGIAVASPFDLVASDPQPGGLTSALTTSYARATARIEALLHGRTPLRGAFSAADFFRLGGLARCYGPTVMFQDHPDALPGQPNDGALPGGDLGLWLELDPETGDACAAAQLAATLEGTSDQALAALMGLASLLVAARDAGLALPAAGSTLDLTAELTALGLPGITWAAATISQAADGSWSYLLDFDYAPGGASNRVVVELTHVPGGGRHVFEGVLSYRLYGDDRDFPGGNCRRSERTFHGSLRYQREALRDIAMQSRTAVFCGHDVDGFVRDAADPAYGLVDPDLRYDPEAGTEGWSEGFTTFVAELDPDTLAGSYALSWQAGVWDSHSRVFNVGVNDHSPTDGEAYFGYGAQAWETDGSIEGFICNWAGPGGGPTLHPYAQRQFVLLDPAAGRFLSAGVDLLYAPTNDCAYDGSGTFVYDRDVDMDLSDENPGAVVAPDLLDTDLDGDGSPDVATIAEAISARGYVLPSAPGGWPGP